MVRKQERRHRGRAWRRTLIAAGGGAVLLAGTRLLWEFCQPSIAYAMPDGVAFALESDEFLRFLSVVTGGAVRCCRVRRFRDGAEFYPAELQAIAGARHAINLEFYEFRRGVVGDHLLRALAERARAGVEVRLIVDALGSFGTPRSYFRVLEEAGGKMRWYHPVRWNTWPQVNNRTHRKLMVIDGRSGFVGGAGIADFWAFGTEKRPAWRDTMLQMDGDGVAGLLSTFAENWLECSGEILSGREEFGFPGRDGGGAKGLVVSSTPHGGSTQARILFQTLIDGARRSVRITTPYFLPDRSAQSALEAAVRRGVTVEIVTAGPHIDHPLVRKLSQQSSGGLLRAGARIFEYQPAMIHAKLMTVDGLWSVGGSTNFDHRSFALNDEVNLAVRDRALAAVIDADFAEDVARSKALTVNTLRRKGWLYSQEDVLEALAEWES